MKRVSHTLRKNERISFPEDHIFFDIETKRRKVADDVDEEVFYLGYACYWRRGGEERKDKIECLYFEDIDTFWDFVVSKNRSKKRLILCAHNARFDLLGLKFASNLTRRGYELISLYETDNVLLLRFKKDNRSILIVDNKNFFRGKLKHWGEVVGLEKIEVDFTTCTDEELRERCKRDVEILLKLWQWWYDFIRENELGNWGVTIASQAFNAFRHRFMNHDIFILADDEISRIEREAYFGGRATPFYQGEVKGEEIFNLDVN